MGEIDPKERQKILKKKREIRNLRKQQKRENNRKRKERRFPRLFWPEASLFSDRLPHVLLF